MSNPVLKIAGGYWMQEIQITAVTPKEKGRVAIRFEDGVEVTLYRGELHKLTRQEMILLLHEGAYIPESLYMKVIKEILGIRVKKRALFLLERMDRTEQQLYDKLRQSGYPEVCVEDAVSYVKQFHYIDDLKYAKNYVRCLQGKKSRQRLSMDLMKKGVARDFIEQALEEEFETDEREKIKELLEKKHYDSAHADRKEQQRVYQFLMRRGYKSGDVLAVMRESEIFW